MGRFASGYEYEYVSYFKMLPYNQTFKHDADKFLTLNNKWLVHVLIAKQQTVVLVVKDLEKCSVTAEPSSFTLIL